MNSDLLVAGPDFDGETWGLLFLLLDQVFDLPSADARVALLDEVQRLAPAYGRALRYLVSVHETVEATGFLSNVRPLSIDRAGCTAIARNWGQVAHAGNGFGTAPNYTAGTSQYSRMVLSYFNTTGTTLELLADGTTAFAFAERRLRFFASQSAFIDATVRAKQVGASEAKVW